MHKSLHILPLILAIVVLLGLNACQFDRNIINSNSEYRVRIARYDHLVDDYVNTGNIALWQKMNTEFPRETRALIENVLKLGPADKDGIEDSLRAYYSDPTIVQLRKDIAKKYDRLNVYEKELSCAFERLEAEHSNFVVPKIYAQNSAFNQSIVVGDSLIGISLDKYMGTDYPAYKKYFYENQRVTMEPSRMVQECLFFYLVQQYPYGKTFPQIKFGDWLIHQGKIGWIVAQLVGKDLIDVAAYQTATKNWYTTHEKQVWNELKQPRIWNSNDKKLVYSIMKTSDKNPYFKDPHSRGVGLWIGMRIVDDYMKSHPKVSLDSLLLTKDYAQILAGSKF